MNALMVLKKSSSFINHIMSLLGIRIYFDWTVSDFGHMFNTRKITKMKEGQILNPCTTLLLCWLFYEGWNF